MTKLAFVGLGVMGFPMAGHLARAGHELSVYNRSPNKTEAWVKQYGGRAMPTPAAAARDADMVMICVGNDDDVRSVTAGSDGILSSLRPGGLLIDHTTASAKLARELYALAKHRAIDFLDAPVSGGQAGAENGKLTIMVGGDETAFTKAQPVLTCYARAVTLMGESGSGQLTKMVNQICIAGLVQGLAEGINFGLKAGLDMERVLDVISKGAAQSWQMENRGKTMIADQFNFGFAVDWMRKDLQICMAEAQHNGAALPVTALLDQFYARVQALGGNRWDTSSLIKLLR